MERIIVNNLSKKFNIGFKKNQGVLARLISAFSGREPKKTLWALKNISFSINSGEFIGIIGENASGKTTLLRLIAGIYEPDGGVIKTNGKIVSLINLFLGLQEKLTMKDNIYLCCNFFGLDQKTIKKRFDSIVEFAELKDFVYTKVYQLSSGMKQRLAFSMAIHYDPDTFLLDEIFELLDESFKEKLAQQLKLLALAGKTILIVSHDLEMIKNCCQRIIWLHQRRIQMDGEGKKVIKEYINWSNKNG